MFGLADVRYDRCLAGPLLTAGNKTYTMSAILHSRCRDTTTRPDSTSHGPPPDMTQDTELNALLLDSLDSFCRDWRAQHPLPNDGVDNPHRPRSAERRVGMELATWVMLY